jgi:hypothetical protein
MEALEDEVIDKLNSIAQHFVLSVSPILAISSLVKYKQNLTYLNIIDGF